jgi:cytochrome c556
LPNSKKLVDKEALDAMKVAVEAAPGVWEVMEEILGSTQDVQADIKDILMRASTVTDRLRENINAVQQGIATADRKALRDDAHTFVKVRCRNFQAVGPH